MPTDEKRKRLEGRGWVRVHECGGAGWRNDPECHLIEPVTRHEALAIEDYADKRVEEAISATAYGSEEATDAIRNHALEDAAKVAYACGCNQGVDIDVCGCGAIAEAIRAMKT